MANKELGEPVVVRGFHTMQPIPTEEEWEHMTVPDPSAYYGRSFPRGYKKFAPSIEEKITVSLAFLCFFVFFAFIFGWIRW